MSDDDENDHDDDRGNHGHDGEAAKPKEPSPGNGDYAVGYKRTPERTRYKPGQSGNPKGRPKGSKNIATLLDEEFRRRVPVNIEGKRLHITKLDALVRQTVHKGISDPKYGLPLMQHVQRSEASRERPNDTAPPLPSGPEQDRIIEEFLRGVRDSAPDDDDPSSRDDGSDGRGGSS